VCEIMNVDNGSEFRCGDLKILPTEEKLFIDKGTTVGGKSCSGTQRVYKVLGGGISVRLAYTIWENGERDVRAISRVEGSMALRRLERGGLRLSVIEQKNGKGEKQKRMYVVLRQARVKTWMDNKWSNLFKCTIEEMEKGAKTDPVDILRRAGALEAGSKGKILGAKDKSKSYLCVSFDRDNTILPVAVFVLTRVLPLINEYPAPTPKSKREYVYL
jgi:hypothetical protein